MRDGAWFGKTEWLGLVGVVDVSRVSWNSFLLVRGGSEGGGLNTKEILLVIKGRCRAMRGSMMSMLVDRRKKSNSRFSEGGSYLHKHDGLEVVPKLRTRITRVRFMYFENRVK